MPTQKPKNNDKKADRTNTLKKSVLEALEKSLGVVTTACRVADINRSTFYEWYHSDPSFKKQVDAMQDIALDFAESQLFQQIKDKDTAATIFYLKTKGKKRGYVERQELTGKDGDELTIRTFEIVPASVKKDV